MFTPSSSCFSSSLTSKSKMETSMKNPSELGHGLNRSKKFSSFLLLPLFVFFSVAVCKAAGEESGLLEVQDFCAAMYGPAYQKVEGKDDSLMNKKDQASSMNEDGKAFMTHKTNLVQSLGQTFDYLCDHVDVGDAKKVTEGDILKIKCRAVVPVCEGLKNEEEKYAECLKGSLSKVEIVRNSDMVGLQSVGVPLNIPQPTLLPSDDDNNSTMSAAISSSSESTTPKTSSSSTAGFTTFRDVASYTNAPPESSEYDGSGQKDIIATSPTDETFSSPIIASLGPSVTAKEKEGTDSWVEMVDATKKAIAAVVEGTPSQRLIDEMVQQFFTKPTYHCRREDEHSTEVDMIRIESYLVCDMVKSEATSPCMPSLAVEPSLAFPTRYKCQHRIAEGEFSCEAQWNLTPVDIAGVSLLTVYVGAGVGGSVLLISAIAFLIAYFRKLHHFHQVPNQVV